MKYKWLNQNNNKTLIMFFNGWGMDENVVEHLNCEGFDVVMFYDYNNLETDFDFQKEYSSKYIIAWSMGVMIASVFSQKCDADKNIVINGTLKPIDENYGIHPKIYDLTIKGFNEQGREKFIQKMFDGNVLCRMPERTLLNQKNELLKLTNYISDYNFKPEKILISKNDKIIPTKNQCAFWNVEPTIEGGHCPFFNYTKWSELL